MPLSLGTIWFQVTLRMLILAFTIFKPHRKFLRFKWSDQIYELTCLPFGYSLAPRVFTKVLKPVISYLRANGDRVVIFLDDIFLIGSSVEECSQLLIQFLWRFHCLMRKLRRSYALVRVS